MARFKPGESGNPKGRPQGSANKVTTEARELFKAIMDGEVPHIEEALGLLRESSPEKYLKALSSLFPYFMPKKLEADVTVNETTREPSWFKDVEDRHGLPDTNALTDE